MLSREENELLCRVGAGTPMGDLMREYWLPGALSRELPGPDSDPRRIMLLGEQFEAHRLRAFIFNFEIARHGSRTDVEGMRLAGPPIGQHPELGSRTVKLRLISHDNGGTGGGRDGCKSPHRSEVGVKMRHVVLEIEFGTA